MNNIKPIGNACPRCAGFYDWNEELGRCVMCGYRWNPALELPKLKLPHCSFGSCLQPIQRIEQVFCLAHQGEIVNAVVRQNIGRQRRWKTKVERHKESHVGFNTPITVRLKKKQN